MSEYPVFHPQSQIAFAARLDQIESSHLGHALSYAVNGVALSAINSELDALAGDSRLTRLASVGLRGETFFPCPVLLKAAPQLLGYYRLLFGLSQKEFYRGEFARFKPMEVANRMRPDLEAELDALCLSLCETAWTLVENLSSPSLTRIRDLQLLTLGQQLKGGRLNEIGKAATLLVFNRIRAAVADSAILSEDSGRIVLRNAAGRIVSVAFSNDPDIAISEELASSVLQKVAIEIKGGTDVSNIHNRLGEAEKSHQKARAKGFSEFWTIINTHVEPRVAAQESPTTNLFFQLGGIIEPAVEDWFRFRNELTARLGVPASP